MSFKRMYGAYSMVFVNILTYMSSFVIDTNALRQNTMKVQQQRKTVSYWYMIRKYIDFSQSYWLLTSFLFQKGISQQKLSFQTLLANSSFFYSQATTCPAIVVPAHGTLQEPACDGASSSCGATCSVSCDRNYPLEGPAYATCLTTGQWSNSIGACRGKLIIVMLFLQ